ncbi:M20/M25/M40 family metallo-hydrolase [Luteimonas pelagia]
MRLRRPVFRPVLIVAGLVAAAACQREPAVVAPVLPPPDAAAQYRIRADVGHLADDRMQGREAGTPGYDRAAAYVVERMREAGLEPAGDGGGWTQAVPLLRATRGEAGARLAIRRDGRTTELAFRDQFLPELNFNAPTHALEAPVVVVGQAVHAPELGHDDFAGVDVSGKIAIAFAGAPARFGNTERAVHGSTREKLRNLAQRGAVGVVWAGTAEDEARSPWARAAANWQRPRMRLRADDGTGVDTFPRLRAIASVSAAAADALFEGGDRTAAQLAKAAREGTFEAFDLPGTIVLGGSTRIERAASHNVVGRLPATPDGEGAAPATAGEHVVYTAHLDHVGVGAPVEGDRVHNGAVDNALGVAVMLESARVLADAPERGRATLFVALTAEEHGLLGAEWFARNPTVPADSIVANVNIDMPVLLAPSRDVVPVGVVHSSLSGVVEAAAADIGVALSPDPFPEEAIFVRSDQYAFVRAGIPAVYLVGGTVPVTPTRKGEEPDPATDPQRALREFLRTCYHQPCDEAGLPIHYPDAARLARLNAAIGLRIGADPARPRWNDGDFLGERFAGAGAADGADAAGR